MCPKVLLLYVWVIIFIFFDMRIELWKKTATVKLPVDKNVHLMTKLLHHMVWGKIMFYDADNFSMVTIKVLSVT